MTFSFPAMNWLFWCGVGAALMMVVGVMLTLLGRRGRRIDDHPVCRKCGYDLTGRPDSSSRCSECGADLSRRRAIRIGNRRRLAGLLRVGWIVLVLGLGGLGWSGYRHARTIDWMPYMPLSWLADDLDRFKGDPAASLEARDEILRRGKANQLAPADETWLIDHMLAQHANPAWPLPADWETVLASSIRRDRVSSAQIEQYVSQVRARVGAAFSTVLKVPATVKRGDPVPIKIATSAVNIAPLHGATFLAALSKRTASPAAGGRTSVLSHDTNAQIHALFTIEEVHLAGTRVAVLPRTQEDPETGLVVYPEWERVRNLADGVHELSVAIHVELMAGTRISTDLRATREVTVVRE